MKMRLIFPALLLLTALRLAAAQYHVDPARGDDAASGSQEAPFRTIRRALAAADGPGGTIHLSAKAGPYREAIVIRKGGSEETPLVIEGHGAVVHLGTDVTAGPWTPLETGEYRLETPVPRHERPYVTSPLFINGLPVWAEHPKGKGRPAWHGGSLRQDGENRFIVRFPKGLTPANSVIVRTGPDNQCVLHSSGASHLLVRDLTVAFAGNDGFNFHNHSRDVVLENVTAIFNGDQGISSHETCEVVVRESEIAFNGSQSAGVTDINQAVTTYQRCDVHQNRNGGFSLSGARHLLEEVRSHGHPGSNLPKPSDTVTLIDCHDEGTRPEDLEVPTGLTPPAPSTSATSATSATQPAGRNDRPGRFLQLRPASIIP